jgi:hypothetical protein
MPLYDEDDPGSAVRRFHVGDAPQRTLPEDDGDTLPAGLSATSRHGLRTPGPRPPWGVDDKGDPRPDPSLVPEPKATEPKAAEKPEAKLEPKAPSGPAAKA